MSERRYDAGHGDLEASLVLVFPVLLAYEIGVLFAGRVNGADVVTRALYATLGMSVLALGVAALLGGRADDIRVRRGSSAGQLVH